LDIEQKNIYIIIFVEGNGVQDCSILWVSKSVDI